MDNLSTTKVFEAIYNAALKYGIEPELLLKIANSESAFNPTIKAGDPNSTSAGLFMFNDGTWAETPSGKQGFSRLDPVAAAEEAARLIADGQISKWYASVGGWGTADDVAKAKKWALLLKPSVRDVVLGDIDRHWKSWKGDKPTSSGKKVSEAVVEYLPGKPLDLASALELKAKEATASSQVATPSATPTVLGANTESTKSSTPIISGLTQQPKTQKSEDAKRNIIYQFVAKQVQASQQNKSDKEFQKETEKNFVNSQKKVEQLYKTGLISPQEAQQLSDFVSNSSFVPSRYITQQYGNWYGGYYGKAGHEGVDYRAATGTPVQAPANWVVTSVNNNVNSVYGKNIIIENPITKERLQFAHMDEINLVPGQKVPVDGIVGKSGATGIRLDKAPQQQHLHVNYWDANGKRSDVTKLVSQPKTASTGLVKSAYAAERDYPVVKTPPVTQPQVQRSVTTPSTRQVQPLQAKDMGKSNVIIINRGDTLSGLAKSFNTSLQQLIAANPQIKNPNKIYAGDALYMPNVAPVKAVTTPPKTVISTSVNKLTPKSNWA